MEFWLRNHSMILADKHISVNISEMLHKLFLQVHSLSRIFVGLESRFNTHKIVYMICEQYYFILMWSYQSLLIMTKLQPFHPKDILGAAYLRLKHLKLTHNLG